MSNFLKSAIIVSIVIMLAGCFATAPKTPNPSSITTTSSKDSPRWSDLLFSNLARDMSTSFGGPRPVDRSELNAFEETLAKQRRETEAGRSTNIPYPPEEKIEAAKTDERQAIPSKEIKQGTDINNASSLESRINKRRAELESSLNWNGSVRTREELLQEASVNNRQAPKACGSNAPILSAGNLAIQEVTTEDLKNRILDAHQNFLLKKTNKSRSVENFNRLKNEVESARKFYNTYISKHCAIGSRMIQGLNGAASETLMLINLMNNFVGDLNKGS